MCQVEIFQIKLKKPFLEAPDYIKQKKTKVWKTLQCSPALRREIKIKAEGCFEM